MLNRFKKGRKYKYDNTNAMQLVSFGKTEIFSSGLSESFYCIGIVAGIKANRLLMNEAKPLSWMTCR